MIPVKYRAWNKITNKMVNLQDITPFALSESMNDQMALQGMGGIFLPFRDDLILEQFTGSMDSTTWEELIEIERERWTRSGKNPSEWNGKEIYAGDISKSDINGSIGVIEWDLDYGMWRNIYKVGTCLSCKDGKFPLWQSFYEIGSNQRKVTIKIIGNIHENLELLK